MQVADLDALKSLPAHPGHQDVEPPCVSQLPRGDLVVVSCHQQADELPVLFPRRDLNLIGP